MKETTLSSDRESEVLLGGGELVEEQDTKSYTVYRGWQGYGYKAGHIDMDCQHSHVNWTAKDLDTIRMCEKVRGNVASLLSIYLL